MQHVAHASRPFLCPYCSGFRRMDCLLQVFTAGPFAMEFSAKMYGATWKFNEQGLPFDLEARYSSARRLGISQIHKPAFISIRCRVLVVHYFCCL